MGEAVGIELARSAGRKRGIRHAVANGLSKLRPYEGFGRVVVSREPADSSESAADGHGFICIDRNYT